MESGPCAQEQTCVLEWQKQLGRNPRWSEAQRQQGQLTVSLKKWLPRSSVTVEALSWGAQRGLGKHGRACKQAVPEFQIQGPMEGV